MAISNLWERTNYLLKIPYISSNYITEYDLSKANISALRYMGYLSEEDYNWLYSADKQFREIYIGNLERNDKTRTVTKLKADGIKEARRLLFFENRLQDKDILSIKNDAVFVIGDRDLKNQFNTFDFKKKNIYTFYMCTSEKPSLEIYYSYNNITGYENIDVKGINDALLPLHQYHMLSFLCQIFHMIQNSTLQDTIQFFNRFYDDYINLRLDIGFYREFNSDSCYRINGSPFCFNDVDNSYLKRDIHGRPIISIDTNLSVLRDVYGVLTDMYFRSQK